MVPQWALNRVRAKPRRQQGFHIKRQQLSLLVEVDWRARGAPIFM
jgi:hypothetical protein